MSTLDRATSDWGKLDQLGPYHISTLPRYWITRLYVALATLAAIVATWLEPDALSHRLISNTGDQGWALVWILALVSIAAVVDVVVNDLLPERFHLRATMRRRHLIYIALAVGIFCMSYAFLVGAAGADGAWFRPLVLPYWLNGAVAAAVAFLDLFQRHRAPK